MIGFLGLGTTLAFLDLAVKNQIEAQEPGEFPRELAGTKGKIKLYRNHNAGFSFGVLKDNRELVETVQLSALSAAAGAWAWMQGKRGNLLEKLAFTLFLAGGASNFYDRKKRGYVVDYFSFSLPGIKKVVFNLGDLFVFLGTALFLLGEMGEEFKKKVD